MVVGRRGTGLGFYGNSRAKPSLLQQGRWKRRTSQEQISCRSSVSPMRHAGFKPFQVISQVIPRSEEHTSELQSLMRISYAVFCLKKKHTHISIHTKYTNRHVTPTITIMRS